MLCGTQCNNNRVTQSVSLGYEKACPLGKIKVVYSLWMYGRLGKRKYKAGVKPKEITIGLLDHVKKFRLYLG